MFYMFEFMGSLCVIKDCDIDKVSLLTEVLAVKSLVNHI